MRFLLDTDTCIFWLRGNEIVRARMSTLEPQDLAVSAVTLAELWYGAAYSSHPDRNRRAVLDFASGIGVLDLSSASALSFGDLKAHLRRVGMLIEDLDLLIAATALAHNLTLVTNNTQHFERIPELSLENWTIEP